MKRLSILVAFFLLFAILSVSGGGQKSGAAGEPGEPVELEFWTFIDPTGEGVRSEGVKHVMTTFEEKNPTVQIKATQIVWNEIGAAVLRAAQAGKTPDVSMLNSALIAKHIAAEAIQPLTPWYSKMSKNDQNDLIILDTSFDAAGKVYGIPYEVRVFGIMYRMDLFEQAGMSMPSSLDALAAMARKFQTMLGEGSSGIGIALKPNQDRAIKMFLPMAVGAGAKILNDDGTAAFNTPEIAKCMNYMHDLVYKDKVMPLDVALMSVVEVELLVESGRMGMSIQGSHKVAKMRQAAVEGVKLSFMGLPGFDENSTSPAMIEGWNLSIPIAAKHPDQAWAFIEHWISPEIQLWQAHNVGYIPMRKSLGNDPSFATKETAHIEPALQYMANNPLQFQWPENTDAIQDALGHAIVSVLSNEKTIEQALKDAEANYNSIVQ
jgi:multiple sugar transport system substrate-binding protein